MSHRYPHAAAIALLALLGSACATPVARRNYARGDLDRLPIQRLDLVVVASNPENAGEELDITPFRSMVAESTLLEKTPNAEETKILATVVRTELERQRYAVQRLILPDHGLGPNTPLSELVRTSTADAVLVVRAVPIDRFSMVEQRTEITSVSLGLGVIRTDTLREHRGRLYLGQVFLFSAGKGLRLASRQAPDFPDGGQLTYGHAFVENGLVLKDEIREPTPEFVELAAERFASRILAGLLPAPRAGAPGELGALTRAEDDDGPLQVFLDEAHVGLELAFEHRIESLEAPVRIGDRQVASLLAGDFAPSGIFQLLPRATFWSPSGVVFGLGVPIGFATNDLKRTLLLDDPNGGDALIQRLEVDGLRLIGLVLDAGLLVPLTKQRPTLFLLPRAFFATELWFLGVGEGTSRTRTSLGAGADLLYRPGDGPVFVRLGLEGRVGLDFVRGGLLAGFASTLGAGWLF